jgi:hypothetical protein
MVHVDGNLNPANQKCSELNKNTFRKFPSEAILRPFSFPILDRRIVYEVGTQPTQLNLPFKGRVGKRWFDFSYQSP